MQAVPLHLAQEHPGTGGSYKKAYNEERILIRFACLARMQSTSMRDYVGGNFGAHDQMKLIYI